MTLTLTERDKKLLVILAVVALVAGLGAGVIYPLMNKAQDLQLELQDARIEKTEREAKVAKLPVVEQQQQTVYAEMEELQKDAYPVMPSLSIDRTLTSLAQARGADVKSLNIEMPEKQSYTSFPSYGQVLIAAASGSSDGQSGESENATYRGIYTAHATMSLSGNRETLQSVIDQVQAEEPNFRITEFNWGQNTSQSTFSLTIGIDVYMYEDSTAYLMNQVMEQMESPVSNEGETSESGAGDSEIE